jgi:hypothetical protein
LPQPTALPSFASLVHKQAYSCLDVLKLYRLYN